MWVWIVVAACVVGVILLGWIANSYRLAKRNKNVARRSPRAVGPGGPQVDEQNRMTEQHRSER